MIAQAIIPRRPSWHIVKKHEHRILPLLVGVDAKDSGRVFTDTVEHYLAQRMFDQKLTHQPQHLEAYIIGAFGLLNDAQALCY